MKNPLQRWFHSSSKREKRRRIAQFESLEERRVLAAAIWNNVGHPKNVDGDAAGVVSPIDALLVVNELNTREFSDPASGLLPKQLDTLPGYYFDVSCDNYVSPIDALLVVNALNRGESDGANGTGVYPNLACSPQLVEGDDFVTEFHHEVTLPDDTSAVKIHFRAPEFDTSSEGSIRDAFEIELTDSEGNQVAFGYVPGRDATYNWSELLEPQFAAGVDTTTSVADEDSTVTVNLSGVAEGTRVRVSARLINNDADDGTSIVLRGFEVIDAQGMRPTGNAGAPGRFAESLPVRTEELDDLTGLLAPSYGRTSLDGENSDLHTSLQVTNLGSRAITGRLVVVVENISEVDAAALHPDGVLPDGRPYWDLTHEMNQRPLEPGDSIQSRPIAFRNSSGERFTYRLRSYGILNQAPAPFGSIPVRSIEAGKTYSYMAAATDPEGQALAYTKVAGPQSMLVEADTGKVTWATDAANVGSHRVTLRATDPHGLFVEQTYALEVVSSLQNRPPIFTSDPVTDAVASSGFEVTTVGVGKAPAGVAVIEGFQGPRLVTANSDDQSIGVYAGENNDRFDHASLYSTGHPTADGQLFDVGYSVDIGLPEFLRTGDRNDVDGLAQGDFNGDGAIDLAAAFNFYNAGTGSIGTFQVTVVLNNGDGSYGSPIVVYEREIGFIYETSVESLGVRDLNGDGFDDIVFAESFSEGRLVTVLANGDGTFAPAVETSFEDHVIGDFKFADIDSDGILDLFGRTITGSSFGGRSRMLFWSKGNSDGSFREPDAFVATRNSGSDETTMPYDLGDFDGDGDLDVAVSGEYPDIEIYHNDGAGNFALAVELTPPNAFAYYNPDWLNVADFTGDGHADILYYHVWQGRLDLFVGDGTGTGFAFQEGNDVAGRIDNWATDHEPIDLDGDGDLDLVMGHEHSDWTSPRVLLNEGDGKFTAIEYPMVDFSGEINPYQAGDIARGALVGDYNSDGVLDFSYFTTGSDFNGVGIRLGTRPGEFGGTASLPLFEGYNGNMVVGDFNGDHILDLMDLRLGQTALGNRAGSYSDPIPAVGFVNGLTGSVADFNLDGLEDVVWSRGNRYTVGISNGDGTFSISDDRLAEGSFYGYNSVLTNDFNADGYPDFIAKTGVERQLDVHLNDPSNPGVFSRSFRYVLTDSSQGVNVSHWQESFDVADYNGDGILDLAYAEREASSNTTIAYTVVMAGDGTGSFTELSRSPVLGEDSRSAAGVGNYYEPGDYNSGDIDGDGDIDLISATSYGARVFLNDGSGAFMFHSWLQNLGTNQRGRDSWLIDFDEDGELDLVSVGLGGYSQLLVRLGNGDATFQASQSIGMVGGAGGGISRMPFADLNGDGHLDFVHGENGVGNYNADTTSFYAGRRDDLVDLVAVDLNGDGNREILAVQEQMERLQIFVGDNLGGLTRINDLLTGRAPKAVTTGDLDGDGQLELITANRASRDLAIFTGDLESGYIPSSFSIEGAPIDVEAADLDDDGHMDLVVLDDQSNALWIYTGNGTTTLAEPIAIALGERPSRLTLADATGDGMVDALVTLPGSQRVMILGGIGLQTVQAPVYVNTASSPSDVVAADLNDDGHPDLAITLPGSHALSIVYGLGNNQFARPQQVSVGATPTRVTLTDADEDGRMDLVVANSGDGTASVVYNRFDPNEVYRYDSDAIDPDGDMISYSIESGPGGLIVNRHSGALLWAASPDQVGVHDVTIAADDGRGGRATQTFSIEVVPARENAAPILATTPVTQIGAGDAFAYTAVAIDRDNHPLRYRLADGPEGATLDPITGELAWDTRDDGALSTFVSYDRTGYVRTLVNDSLQSTSITVEGWFNWKQLPAGNGADYLFFQSNDLGATYGLHNRFNDRLRFEANLSGGVEWFDIPFQFELDRWYHFALTVDDATHQVAVYADGQQLATFTLSESLRYVNRNIAIHDSFFQFQGATDNYRIWNVARSPQQIIAGMSAVYENEPNLVLDYRFGEEQMLSVHDHSGNGNHGYRVTNGNPPGVADGLARTGPQTFTISVEDGRGGYDEQTFTLDVLPELRGSIVGQLFEDLNGDGDRDDGSEEGVAEERWLENWHVFIDTNGNTYPDPNEPQALTDAEGRYGFAGILPGEYTVRVTPVAGFEAPAGFTATVEPGTKRELGLGGVTNYDLAIEQLSLGQIRGQLRTEDADAIAYWKVFADLDGDGQRGSDEPMAVSDRDGNYAIAGLGAGTYNIKPELPAGWASQASRDGLVVTIAADEIAAAHDFVLEPTSTSVTGGIHFFTKPETELEARQTFRYAAVAMGVYHSEISYDLSLAPEGMAVDPTTGRIAWRPTIDQVGEHLVILRATDASGSIALQEFYLNVTAPNTPPVIRGIGSLAAGATGQPQPADVGFVAPSTAYVGHNFLYDVIAQDAESTELVYALTQSPVGASIDPATGRIAWTPTTVDLGNHDFTVEVTDEAGATLSATWTVQVEDSSPVLLPLEITLPRSTAALTTDYFSRISASDAMGRPVTWTLTEGPTGMRLLSDGTLEWTPSNLQLGLQGIELAATTADGTVETIRFTIEVLGRLQNVAPVIESHPVLSVALGQRFQYDMTVSDSDHDVHAFTLLAGPTGMSVHPSLGYVSWSPMEDQLGEHDVLMQVSDPSGATAEQAFTLTASRLGGPPRITSIPPTEAYVGSGFLYSVASIDREGDPLTYTLLTAPTGMTIVENTGEIAWTPIAGQVGLQDVVVQVSDGIGGAATQAFAVNVNAGIANSPPVIMSLASRFAVAGTDFIYTIAATDPEGTAIAYSLGQGPAGMTVDASTGQVAWTPGVGDEGKHVVTFIATDAGGATAIESFELDVLAQNTVPTIDSDAPTQSTAGALFSYQVLASDTDLDALTFELKVAPEGAKVDAFGRIEWPTELGDEGTYAFQIIVHDPRGGEAMQSFNLDLVADTAGPVISLIEQPIEASRNVLPWQGPFTVYVRAIDNVDVASLTLTANGKDIPLDAAGTATFTFEEWTFQSIQATATAIDTSGNATSKTISFDYDIPEGWSGVGGDEIPTAIISSPGDAESVTGMVTIFGTAAHEDFDIYRLSYRRVDETNYTEFHTGRTAVENGALGVWDTSLLLNDEYVIRLEVATSEGVANVVERYVGLAGELKLGNFQLSFTDMVLPVAGIPIEITRIYDTLQADRAGEFGYGWRLEYRNTDLRVGLPKSGLEDIGIYSALRPGVKVYLNVPGQGRQGFTFNPDIRVLPGWGGNNLVLARPRFTPDPGVTSTLSTGTSSYLHVSDRGELFAPGNIPYNPASPDFGGAYVLTTRNGTIYRIDGASGKLNSVRARNGVELVFSDFGVRSSVGKEVTFARDAAGRITAATDEIGNIYAYEYSSYGDLIASVDQLGNRTRYSYDSNREHYLQDVTDPLGRRGIRSEYDEQGRLIRQVDAGGSTYSYAVDPAAQVQTVADPFGNLTTYAYDTQGNLLTLVDALGNVTAFEYDANGNRVSQTNPLEETTRYRFDASGNPVTIIDAAGGLTLSTYNAFGQPMSITDQVGRTTTLRYDDDGNPISQRDPLGNTVSQTFDEFGNRASNTDANGNTTQFLLANGFDVGITNAAGGTTQFENNANGQIIREVFDVAGFAGSYSQETSFGYDGSGELVSVENSKGIASTVSTDAAGQLIASVAPDGKTQALEYNARGDLIRFDDGVRTALFERDVLGRSTKVTFDHGLVYEYQYDALGRKTSVTNAGDQTTYIYDALGRLATSIDSAGHETHYTYDVLGNLVETHELATGVITTLQYDASGILTSTRVLGADANIELDAAGRVTRVEYGDGTSEAYQYDAVGNVVTRETRSGETWRYTYNELNSLESTIDPSGRELHLGFDSVGRGDSYTDALGRTTRAAFGESGDLIYKQLPLGQTKTYSFTDAGVPTGWVDYDGSILSMEYDPSRRLTRVADGMGATIESHTYPDPFTKTTSNRFGTSTIVRRSTGQIEQSKSVNGQTIQHGYSSENVLESIQSSLGATRVSFAANDYISQLRTPEGNQVDFTYSPYDQPAEISYSSGLRRVQSEDPQGFIESFQFFDSTGAEILRQSIDLNADTRIESVIEQDGRETRYAYDSLGQLIRESTLLGGVEQSIKTYEYDAVGNLVRSIRDGVERVSTYDANDRLVSSGATTMEFDDVGNLTRRAEGGTVEDFEYDELQRLIRYERAGANSAIVTYAYDADGLLASRTENGIRTDYLWDRTGSIPFLYEVLDANGNLMRRYHNDASKYVAVENANGTMDAIATNVVGTPIGLIGNDGGVHRIDYDAFGNLLGENPLDIGFGGGLIDATSQLTYFVSRWYDPTTGRFTQTDDAPADDFDSRTFNRYVFSLNDPVNRIDPLGQLSFTLTEKLAAFAITSTLIAAGALNVAAQGESIVNRISGDKTNFLKDNKDGTLRPFFEATISGGAKAGYGPASVSGQLVGSLGYEEVSLDNQGASRFYWYYGGLLQAATGIETGGERVTENTNVGIKPTLGAQVQIRLFAKGDVFDTATYGDYTGTFRTLIGGGSAVVKGGGGPLDVSPMTNIGFVKSLAWAPQPNANVDQYSHTRTIFTGRSLNGSYYSGEAKSVSLSFSLKFGLGTAVYDFA